MTLKIQLLGVNCAAGLPVEKHAHFTQSPILGAAGSDVGIKVAFYDRPYRSVIDFNQLHTGFQQLEFRKMAHRNHNRFSLDRFQPYERTILNGNSSRINIGMAVFEKRDYFFENAAATRGKYRSSTRSQFNPGRLSK